ncbi:cysteine proteinase [Cadophora sp. DSE1049]|nr:cysteine proteinase [Cadophora sp. DSE1049]
MSDYESDSTSASGKPRRRQKRREPEDSDEARGNSSSDEEKEKDFAFKKLVRILPQVKPRKKKSKNRRASSITNGESAVASYDEAVNVCKKRVDEIGKKCRRLNHKYIDPDFDCWRDQESCLLPLQGVSPACRKLIKGGPKSVKRVGEVFKNPQFFTAEPANDEIRQGRIGNCWLISALCALTNKPGLIKQICVARDEDVGVYSFVFHRDGDWFPEVIDDRLFLTFPNYDRSTIERRILDEIKKEYNSERLTTEEEYRDLYQRNSGALYFGSCQNPNQTWFPLLEKAFAKAHGDYLSLEGGFAGEALEDLTGGVTDDFHTYDILDRDHFWSQLLAANEQFLFTCSAGSGDERYVSNLRQKGIVAQHAYTVKRAVEMDGHRLVLLKNPLGRVEWRGPWSDGSSEWTADDGVFWIAYNDLLSKYFQFQQTRLFTDEWTMAQKWTTLNIPIINKYHRTKFSFTITKTALVVIVLSKLDARYFRGFGGRYYFSLGFCIRKAGSGQPIVYTYQARWIKRSVRAELTLEAGRFRQKLLRIARSYEAAHARGHDEDSEEEKKLYQKRMSAQKAKDLKRYKRLLMKMKRQIKHSQNRKKRKARAAKEKRKAKKPNKTKTRRHSKLAERDEESESDTGVKDGPRMTRSQAKSRRKVKGRPPRAAQPEDEDELGNASAAPPSSEPDDDDSDLNSDVSDISDNEVEELFMKIIEKKMQLQAKKPPLKSDTPAQAKQKERERLPAEGTNEFELDPWNASVVVGLRVYSKLSDVTLEVIRPDFEESDSSDADEEEESGNVVVAVGNVQETGLVESVDEEMTDQQESEMEWLPEGMSPQTKKFFFTHRR